MGANKSHALTENCQRVFFKLVDTAGTPSIANVFPPSAASDISVADTAQGRATVTIKNFKGGVGESNIQVTTQTTSVWASVVSKSYSGNDLSFEISIENDASTLTDSTADVCAVAY